MEMTVNKPLAETYGWLGVGEKKISLPEEPHKEEISLAAGEERTVYAENPSAVEYEISLAEKATLHFVQLSAGGAASPVYNRVLVHAADGAHFAWYRLALGGGEAYDNCSVLLAGEGSRFDAHIAYHLKKQDLYDINCEAIHTGRRTESAIQASGVLADEASKLLRGTIDFRSGCAGAVGNESEDVLLLSDEVRNRSVPVILCGEEDVVGNHGASIGRPDESLLYYMETRGVPEEEALKLLAQAKIEAVLGRIPDEALRDLVRQKGEGAWT